MLQHTIFHLTAIVDTYQPNQIFFFHQMAKCALSSRGNAVC